MFYCLLESQDTLRRPLSMTIQVRTLLAVSVQPKQSGRCFSILWTFYGFSLSAASLHSVLFSTADFSRLVSWLTAFCKMLSVLTSKLRARLSSSCITSHSSPPGLLRGSVRTEGCSNDGIMSSLHFSFTGNWTITVESNNTEPVNTE